MIAVGALPPRSVRPTRYLKPITSCFITVHRLGSCPRTSPTPIDPMTSAIRDSANILISLPSDLQSPLTKPEKARGVRDCDLGRDFARHCFGNSVSLRNIRNARLTRHLKQRRSRHDPLRFESAPYFR